MPASKKSLKPRKPFFLPFNFCVVCGTEKRLTGLQFTHAQKNNATTLARFAGNYGILIEYFALKPILLEAAFCLSCARNFTSVDKISQLFHLGYVVAIFIAVLLAYPLSLEFGVHGALAALCVGFVAAVVVRIVAKNYIRRISPRIVSLSPDRIEVDIPNKGKLSHTR